MKGRLSKCADFWRYTLNASAFVMSMTEKGYRLPFTVYPLQCFTGYNASALKDRQFVADAINELSNECIVEHNARPY